MKISVDTDLIKRLIVGNDKAIELLKRKANWCESKFPDHAKGFRSTAAGFDLTMREALVALMEEKDDA